YSIKDIEAFFMDRRQQEVTEAGDSIVRFEQWLDSGEQAQLDAIEVYNEADCLSTLELHRWLLERREEAENRFGVELAWREAPKAYEQSPESVAIQDEVARLEAGLLTGLPENIASGSKNERGRWLAAQLLHYHRREEKPAWWGYFARTEMSTEELVDDLESI